MHRPHLLILLLALLITLVVADMTDEEREIEEARIRAEKDRDLDRTPPQPGSGPSSIRDLNACYLTNPEMCMSGSCLTNLIIKDPLLGWCDCGGGWTFNGEFKRCDCMYPKKPDETGFCGLKSCPDGFTLFTNNLGMPGCYCQGYYVNRKKCLPYKTSDHMWGPIEDPDEDEDEEE